MKKSIKKTKELELLKKKELNKELKIWYLDGCWTALHWALVEVSKYESGFTLNSYVPYAWQEKGKYIEVKTSKSKRINIVGFITRDNDFISNFFEGNVTKSTILSCIDDFVNQTTGKNVIVMDGYWA